jgi:hypothetical protein
MSLAPVGTGTIDPNQQMTQTIEHFRNQAAGSDLNKLLGEVALILKGATASVGGGGPKKDDSQVGARPILVGDPMDPSELQAKLVEVRERLSNEQIQTGMAHLEGLQKNQQAQQKKDMEKLLENIKKIEQADKAGFWGKLFGWIAAIVMVVVAVVAIASGVGAAAGAALIVAAALTVATMIDQTFFDGKGVGKLGEGIGKLIEFGAKLFGKEMDPAQAKMIGTIVAQVLIAVAIVALTIFAGPSAIAAIGNTVTRVMQLLQAASMIGQGVSQICGSAFKMEAGINTADMKKIAAMLAQIQQSMEETQSWLKEVLQKLEDFINNFVQMISAGAESRSTIAQA